MRANRLLSYAIPLLCGLLALCLSLANLNSASVWTDDVFLLADKIGSPSEALRALTHGFSINDAAYWRPLSTLSFGLTNGFSNPLAAGRLFNLFLYILAGAALTFFATTRSPLLSEPAPSGPRALLLPFALGLIFIHPIWVEPLQWIAGRFDLLGCVFLFAMFALRAKHPGAKKTSALLFALALFSKDALVLFLPSLLIFYTVLSKPGTAREAGKRLLSEWPLALASALCLGLRAWALSNATGNINFELPIPWDEKAQVFFQSFAQYAIALLAPIAPSAPLRVFNPEAALPVGAGVALLAVLIATLLISLKKRAFHIAAPTGALVAHLIALSLVNALARYSLEAIAADRYLLADLPLLLSLMIAGVSGLSAKSWQIKFPLSAATALAMLFGLCAFAFSAQTGYWSGPQTFWSTARAMAPWSAMASLREGDRLEAMGRSDLALKSVEASALVIESSKRALLSVRLSWNANLIAAKARFMRDAISPSASLAYLNEWINLRQQAPPPILAETARQLYIKGSCDNARRVDQAWRAVMTPGLLRESRISSQQMNTLSQKCFGSKK